MLQLRRRLDLGQKTLGTQGSSQVGMKHLDRHIPLVPNVVCEIHRRHAADTDLTRHAIPVTQGFSQAREDVAHAKKLR